MAFEGHPMIVPMPPRLAPVETPNSNPLLKPILPRDRNKGIIDATIIAVVAVLDINIEAIIVVNISAMMIFLGFVPERRNTKRSILSSILVLVMAEERKKPPS